MWIACHSLEANLYNFFMLSAVDIHVRGESMKKGEMRGEKWEKGRNEGQGGEIGNRMNEDR